MPMDPVGQLQATSSVLSPSTLARYFFQDCALFLKFRTAPKEIRDRDSIPDKRFDTSAVMQTLQHRGATWEQEVLQHYLDGKVLIARGMGPIAQRQHSVDATLRHLRAGDSLYQPTLSPKPGALGIDPKLATFTDIRPDLIMVSPDPHNRGPLFRIIDIKSASIERFTQKIQVYLYARLLDEVVRNEGIPGRVDLSEGAVWLGGHEKPTPVSFADLAPLMDTFLGEDLPRILSGSTAGTLWHLQYRCEWCEYYEHCRAEADRKRDISLVPGLTPADKAFVQDNLKVSSLEELGVALKDPKSANTVLRGSAALRGRRVELAQRIEALLTKACLRTTAASPKMPKRQDVALHLVLVPDNVNHDVAFAGYLLAMSGRHATAIFDQPRPAPQVVFRDYPEFVRQLHADLRRIADWNTAQAEWKDRISVVPFVYSIRERELLLKVLFGVLSDSAGPRNEALDLLLLLEGSELVDVEESGDQPAFALPVVVVSAEVSSLFAVPASVSPTFPEVMTALTSDSEHPFAYARHDLFDFPLGLALRDEALHGPHGANGAGRTWLESRVKQRLFGMRALVWRIQALAGDRLPVWPPKFSFWSTANFNDSKLAQLTFVARYESVSQCQEVRALRFQATERLLESGSAIRLRIQQEGWFELVLQEAAIGLEASRYARYWLVPDTPEGRDASISLRDYDCGSPRRTKNGGMWVPEAPPSPARRAVRIEEVQPAFPATPQRLRLRPVKEREPVEWPKRGHFFLFHAFLDWNTTRVVDALRAIDAKNGSPINGFLEDPASFARVLHVPKDVRTEAIDLGVKAFKDQHQRQILDTVLDRQLTAIIGPPGTGKTRTLVQLLNCIATAHAAAKMPFRAFVTAFTHSAIDELHDRLNEWKPKAFEVQRVRQSKCIDELARKAQAEKQPIVVLATTIELLRAGNRDAQFDLVIIDEASQMRLPEAALAIDRLTPNGRLVLCGDDQQLGPIFHGVYPGREEDDQRFDPATSVFTHALCSLDRVNPERDHPARVALTSGYRMNDVLTSVPCALLYGLELRVHFQPANRDVARRRLMLKPAGPKAPPLKPYVAAALDPSVPLVILEVDETSPQRESETEATLVAEITRPLRDWLPGCTSEAAPEEKGLFIVSPHHVQIAAIRRKLSNDFSVLPLVDTVEKMQGKTCEVVIVSYGVADANVAMSEDEFIYDRNRLNVALSRARSKAILIVSRPLLDPPPSILDRERAAKGFAFLREIIDQAQNSAWQFQVEVGGKMVGARLLGMSEPLRYT